MRKVIVLLPDGFLEAVDRVAEAERRSRSELIREALRMNLAGRKGALRPVDQRQVRAAAASLHAAAKAAPGTREDSAEDVRYWRERRR